MTLTPSQQVAVDGVVSAFEAVNAEMAACDLEYEALKKEYEQYKASHPDAPSPVTLPGSSVNGPLFTDLGYTKVPVTRVYLRALPSGSTWTNIVGDKTATSDIAHAAQVTTQVLWLSWKEQSAALLNAFLATMPKDLPFAVWGTALHEPENDLATLSAAQYINVQKQQSPIVRKYGLSFATILMRYTFQANSGRNWKTWFPLELKPYVDIFGCDSYNLGNKKGLYSDVDAQLSPIKAAADEVGLPWAIGETGASIFNNDAARRAQWAADLMDKGVELGALAMAWWDQDSYKFDKPTADVWFM